MDQRSGMGSRLCCCLANFNLALYSLDFSLLNNLKYKILGLDRFKLDLADYLLN